MPKQTGKGRQRRASALERKAVPHHDFIGEADAERAEAEFRKREAVDRERNQDAAREMAAELEEMAGVKHDGAMGPEIPFRIPRSVEEARKIIREAPDALREKARERLEKLPEPAQKALQVAESAISLMLAPARFGLRLVRGALKLPLTMLQVLREREA